MIPLPLLTNSRMSCAKACLRRHQYAFELGIRPARVSEALGIGTAVHAGLEAFAKAAGTFEERQAAALSAVTALYDPVPEAIQDLNAWAIQRVRSERLVHAYLCRYQNDQLEVVAAELIFQLPLVNPETGAASRTFALGGKLDKIVKLSDGRLAVLETKTTGDPINEGSDWWAKWRLDSQVSLYWYAARQLGYDVSCVLIDAVGKPLIRQSLATPVENRKFKKDGTLYANQREADEPVPEFADRYSECLATEPERYFARREVPRLEADIFEAQAEWWQMGQMLHDCQRQGRWFRNTGSCLHPYPCQYRELCWSNCNVETSLPASFIHVLDVNPELAE